MVSSRQPHLLGVLAARPDGGTDVVTLNLGIALAQLGKRTTIADLGGSDVRRMLGLFHKVEGISEFVGSGRRSFNGLITPAPVPNLRILGPGLKCDGREAFAYPPDQKMQLFRALAAIEDDFVLVDLGTALSEHAAHFFSMANAGLLAVSADPSEVIRAYKFLKSVVYKTIRQRLGPESETARLLAQLERTHPGAQTPSVARTATIAHVTGLVRHRVPEEADVIDEICDTFAPLLIVSAGQSLRDMELGDKLRVICRRYLSLRVEYLGFIYEETAIDRAHSSREPVVLSHPNSRAAVAMHRIAHKCAVSKTLANAHPDAAIMAAGRQRPVAPSAGLRAPEAGGAMIGQLLAGRVRREISEVERHLAKAESQLEAPPRRVVMESAKPAPAPSTGASRQTPKEGPKEGPAKAPVRTSPKTPARIQAERLLKTVFSPADLRALEALIDTLDETYFSGEKWKWKVRALSTPDRVVHHLISRGIRRDFFYREAPAPDAAPAPPQKAHA